jgi:hypothetical protein
MACFCGHDRTAHPTAGAAGCHGLVGSGPRAVPCGCMAYTEVDGSYSAFRMPPLMTHAAVFAPRLFSLAGVGTIDSAGLHASAPAGVLAPEVSFQFPVGHPRDVDAVLNTSVMRALSPEMREQIRRSILGQQLPAPPAPALTPLPKFGRKLVLDEPDDEPESKTPKAERKKGG